MGSPNFSITSGSNYVRGIVWGLVPHIPTDEDVQYAVENGEYEDQTDLDTVRQGLYQDNIDYVSNLYSHTQVSVESIWDIGIDLWTSQGFDEGIFPYDLKLEIGHDEGFAVGIVDGYKTGYGINTTKYYEVVWDHYASWSDYFIHIGMTCTNYWRAANKVADFMQWAIDQMARCYGLQVITGCGWTQGSSDYNWDEYEPHDQAFKWATRYPQFNHELMIEEFGDIQRANKVDWLSRRLSLVKCNHVWTVWVGGEEVNDHLITWYEAAYIANTYIEKGYDDVAIRLTTKGNGRLTMDDSVTSEVQEYDLTLKETEC